MASFHMRWIGLAGMVAFTLMTVGCSSTRINFRGPPGTVMFVEDKPYHLPAQVEVTRPGGSGESKRYNVSLVFTTQQQPMEVRAKGYLDVFGYSESDIDKMAANTCNLDETELVKILDGSVVIFKGQSASRQPLYDLTLTKQ